MHEAANVMGPAAETTFYGTLQMATFLYVTGSDPLE